MTETVTYELTVNGEPRVVEGAWFGESLLYVLRERLGLPGSKNACEQGECGSCSVRLDARLVCACLVLAADAQGRAVTTVEGLAGSDGVGDIDETVGACAIDAVAEVGQGACFRCPNPASCIQRQYTCLSA